MEHFSSLHLRLSPHPPLILLIGLPGSGKTSLARQIQAQYPGCKVIGTDAIRQQLWGDEAIQGPWLQVWREVSRQFYQAVNQIQQGSLQAAIYDATNAARRQRRQVMALAGQAGFTRILGIWVDTPLEICLQRNQHRDRQVPESVILQMSRQLQGAPPSLSEGFALLIRDRSRLTELPLPLKSSWEIHPAPIQESHPY